MAEVDIHAPGVECIKTQCYFCHANCGVLAYVKDGDVIKIEGDPEYTNQGGLCCRGTSALTHVNHPGRVNHALKRAGKKGEGKWEQIDYDQAIQEVADRLNQIKEESGAESVASCGGTTRTDDWARRRFLNQFGTPNGFHNALLCWIPTFMAETCVAGWSPFETDLGGAKSLILWGMNPGASTLPSMHGYWDLIQNGMKTIVVDPRYSETAAKADLWLPLLPGTDCALALSLLYCAVVEGLCNFEFCTEWCDGFDDLMGHVVDYTPEWASEITGLDAQLIRDAATMYCTNTPGCIQWGCTWDQLGRASTTTSHALQCLRAVTGNLEVPGGDGMPGPIMNALCDEELELNELLPEEVKSKQIGSNKFKLTSWPGYTKISKMNRRTWGKTLPTEWFCEAHGPSVFKAILTKDPYEVRGLIVNASNPINSYGDSKMTLAAIKAVEFLVVVDYWITPVALFADYVFPAAGALERPTIITHYGATDSVMGGRRAIQPKYDRHTDMTFWRKLGLACGQDPANWPWETEEEAYWAIIQSIGLPVNSYNEFVDKIRMYYPPLHQSKYISRGGFWTPTGKVELNSTILQELGYPGMPTYLGCSENPIDDPELAEEYPIRLTTGGGFMPFHHSEWFNMPYVRYISPDPYFFINPELAEKLEIKQYDWCWIETRRGRIKMRADVDNIIDPRAIMCPRGWWFPERDGSADLDNPFGCLESNVNTLTSVDDEHCDPMGGSWANRGLLCKVYKCVAGDDTYTYEDTKWSIPGSDPRKGKTVEEAVHRMPSEVIKAREDIPFTPPRTYQGEIPEGFEYQWQDDTLYHIATNWKRDAAGWIINPKTKAKYDAYTMWRLDEKQNLLVDDNTGLTYDMSRQRAQYWGPILCYPGMAQAPYELPASVQWDAEKGCALAFGLPYNKDTGWCVDPATNVYYDSYTGWAFDPTNNVLVDAAGNWYDLQTRARIVMIGTMKAFPGMEQAPYELPAHITWVPYKGAGYAFGKPYNKDTGWCFDPATNVYYDSYTGLAFDPTQNNLVDMVSGHRYDLNTRAPLTDGPDILQAVANGAPRPATIPDTVTWDPKTGLGTAFGIPYDEATGWCIEPTTNVYYDVYTGLAYLPDEDLLVDMATGHRYDKETRLSTTGGPDVLCRMEEEAIKSGMKQPEPEPEPEVVAEASPETADADDEWEYFYVYEPIPEGEAVVATTVAAAPKKTFVESPNGPGFKRKGDIHAIDVLVHEGPGTKAMAAAKVAATTVTKVVKAAAASVKTTVAAAPKKTFVESPNGPGFKRKGDIHAIDVLVHEGPGTKAMAAAKVAAETVVTTVAAEGATGAEAAAAVADDEIEELPALVIGGAAKKTFVACAGGPGFKRKGDIHAIDILVHEGPGTKAMALAAKKAAAGDVPYVEVDPNAPVPEGMRLVKKKRRRAIVIKPEGEAAVESAEEAAAVKMVKKTFVECPNGPGFKRKGDIHAIDYLVHEGPGTKAMAAAKLADKGMVAVAAKTAIVNDDKQTAVAEDKEAEAGIVRSANGPGFKRKTGIHAVEKREQVGPGIKPVK